MYSSYSSPNSCNNNKLQCTLCAQKTMLFGSHLCRRSWVCRGWWTRTPPWKWVLSISKRPLKAVLRIRSKLTWIRIRLQDLKKLLRTLSKVIPIQSRRICLSPDKPKPNLIEVLSASYQSVIFGIRILNTTVLDYWLAAFCSVTHAHWRSFRAH